VKGGSDPYSRRVETWQEERIGRYLVNRSEEDASAKRGEGYRMKAEEKDKKRYSPSFRLVSGLLFSFSFSGGTRNSDLA